MTDVITARLRRSLQASTVATSCIIDYDITISASTVAGYSSPEAAYNATKTALTASVSSGSFTATLQSVATTAGLTTLSKANSSALVVSAATVLVTVNTASPSTAPTASANSNGKDDLNRGEISAIVICSVVFVVAVVGIAYYFLLQRRATVGSPILPFYALSDHVDPSQQQQGQQQEQQQQQGEQLASQYPEPQHIVQYEQQPQQQVMILGVDTPIYPNPVVCQQQEQSLQLATTSQDEDMKQVVIQT